MIAPARIIDPSTGLPFLRSEGRARKELAAFLDKASSRRRISASYDAAGQSDEFKNYWANADSYDADSANSQAVRHKLIRRSRYDIYNNGFSDGIAQTYATDLVGIGPKLRMQTKSKGFNQLVEFEFYLWCKAIGLRRKLWCMAHAKHSDGEAFGVMRRNPRVRHAVKLDLVLYEAEQVSTPNLGYSDAGYIDGIKFDEFGNPLWYDIMRSHPGGSGHLDFEPEHVDAQFVLHWFKMRRPGQHRGIPECVSTMNASAAARRWREATIAAAETAADFTLFLETEFDSEDSDLPTAMSTLGIQKRMMTALPHGTKPFQMKAEHPTATYEAFHKALVNEQARPKSMPYNKAACDSSSYNYASGRLDHQTYYGSLDVDRTDGDDLVLDRMFDIWFDQAITKFGWLGGDPEAVGPAARVHSWDWPKHLVADIQAEANANDKNLKNGTTTLSAICSESGEDFEDSIVVMASDYGVSVDEMRVILRTAIFNSQNQLASQQQADNQSEAARTEGK